MKEAFSMYLGRSVDAIECSYLDYKILGLYCPNCLANVYLRIPNEYLDIEPYFAHAKNQNPECTERVYSSGSCGGDSYHSLNRNQKVEFFNEHLLKIVLDAVREQTEEKIEIGTLYKWVRQPESNESRLRDDFPLSYYLYLKIKSSFSVRGYIKKCFINKVNEKNVSLDENGCNEQKNCEERSQLFVVSNIINYLFSEADNGRLNYCIIILCLSEFWFLKKIYKDRKNITDEYQFYTNELNKIFCTPTQRIEIYLECLSWCVKYLDECVIDLLITSCINILTSIDYAKKVYEYKKRKNKVRKK